MSVLNYLLTLIILPTLVFRATQDKREYSRFKKLSSTYQRQASYKKWALESFLMFGVGGLIMLVATDNVALLFDTNKRLAQALPYFNELRSSQELRPILIGAALSALLTPIISHVSRDSKKKPLIGDVYAMIPRNNPERIWMGLLSINAGFSEEIFFRVLLPALLQRWKKDDQR